MSAIADAGSDSIYAYGAAPPTVTMTGSGTGVGGALIVGYTWTIVSWPTGSTPVWQDTGTVYSALQNPVLTSLPTVGDVVISLVVEDENGNVSETNYPDMPDAAVVVVGVTTENADLRRLSEWEMFWAEYQAEWVDEIDRMAGVVTPTGINTSDMAVFSNAVSLLARRISAYGGGSLTIDANEVGRTVAIQAEADVGLVSDHTITLDASTSIDLAASTTVTVNGGTKTTINKSEFTGTNVANSTIKTSNIVEVDTDAGVTIEGTLLKDGLVDGVDVGLTAAAIWAKTVTSTSDQVDGTVGTSETGFSGKITVPANTFASGDIARGKCFFRCKGKGGGSDFNVYLRWGGIGGVQLGITVGVVHASDGGYWLEYTIAMHTAGGSPSWDAHTQIMTTSNVNYDGPKVYWDKTTQPTNASIDALPTIVWGGGSPDASDKMNLISHTLEIIRTRPL